MKRMAAQIASQLPEDDREALIVLNYVREIICNLGRSWEIPSAMPNAIQPIQIAAFRKGQEAS